MRSFLAAIISILTAVGAGCGGNAKRLNAGPSSDAAANGDTTDLPQRTAQLLQPYWEVAAEDVLAAVFTCGSVGEPVDRPFVLVDDFAACGSFGEGRGIDSAAVRRRIASALSASGAVDAMLVRRCSFDVPDYLVQGRIDAESRPGSAGLFLRLVDARTLRIVWERRYAIER